MLASWHSWTAEGAGAPCHGSVEKYGIKLNCNNMIYVGKIKKSLLMLSHWPIFN